MSSPMFDWLQGQSPAISPPPPFRTATVQFRGFEPGTWDAVFLVECQGQWSCLVSLAFPELLDTMRPGGQLPQNALLQRIQGILTWQGVGIERDVRLHWHPETREKYIGGRQGLLALIGDIRIFWKRLDGRPAERWSMEWRFVPLDSLTRVDRYIHEFDMLRFEHLSDVANFKLRQLKVMVQEIEHCQDYDLRLRLLTGDEVGEEKRAWAKDALQLAFDDLLRVEGYASLNDQFSHEPLRAQEIADRLDGRAAPRDPIREILAEFESAEEAMRQSSRFMPDRQMFRGIDLSDWVGRQVLGNTSQVSAEMDLDETIAVLELAGWKLGDINEFLEIQGYPEVTEGAGIVFLPTKQHRLCWESPWKFTQRVKGEHDERTIQTSQNCT